MENETCYVTYLNRIFCSVVVCIQGCFFSFFFFFLGGGSFFGNLCFGELWHKKEQLFCCILTYGLALTSIFLAASSIAVLVECISFSNRSPISFSFTSTILGTRSSANLISCLIFSADFSTSDLIDPPVCDHEKFKSQILQLL